jgi:hypothetical protein
VQQQQAAAAGPRNWAEEFHEGQQQGGWAAEFDQQQQEAAAGPVDAAAAAADARATSARLVDVLSADADPKMQNSKFLQFLSKMSKGELMFEDNKVGSCCRRQVVAAVQCDNNVICAGYNKTAAALFMILLGHVCQLPCHCYNTCCSRTVC